MGNTDLSYNVYIHCSTIYKYFAYFKHAYWTTLQSAVGQAIKNSWRLCRMLDHSISKLALPWHSERVLKKMSGVGSTWNESWCIYALRSKTNC